MGGRYGSNDKTSVSESTKSCTQTQVPIKKSKEEERRENVSKDLNVHMLHNINRDSKFTRSIFKMIILPRIYLK
jgi:hypothetical protein